MPVVALLALALAGALPPLPPDWTTREGKTYHDVYDEGHNTLEVLISSEEGNAWIQLADLPTDIQRHYGYDARRQAAMDAYLPLLRDESINGEISTPGEIQDYATHVKRLVGNPALLHTLSEADIVWLQEERLIGGGYISYKLPKGEADALIHGETELVGLIAMAMEARANPAVDLKTPMSANDLPLELSNQHPTPEERKAYDAEIATQQKRREAFNAEWQVRRSIERSLQQGKYYLRVLYHHTNDDNTSIEPQVRPLLADEGVDPATIDFLLGKTTYKIR